MSAEDDPQPTFSFGPPQTLSPPQNAQLPEPPFAALVRARLPEVYGQPSGALNGMVSGPILPTLDPFFQPYFWMPTQHWSGEVVPNLALRAWGYN